MSHLRNPQRILHIVSSTDRGGAESLIMNIYRNLDRRKLQFDFITHKKEDGDYDDEIRTLGGIIYNIPSLGTVGPIRYMKELLNIMSDNHYIAIHAHTDFQSGFPALAAKISGIKKRVCHSHSNSWPREQGMKNNLILRILQATIRFSATNYCSCSKEAGEFLFGKELMRSTRFSILNNGIDVSQFLGVGPNARESVIEEFNLPSTAKLIGHVGRFSESKNQIFMLKLLKKLLEKDESFYVFFVGDGPLKEYIREAAEKMEVDKHVRFLGVREDIPKLMKAFDVFLLPSLFEGFGIVALEAQAAGTPCVLSDSIPKTTDMGLQLVSFVSLGDELEVWVSEINKALSSNRPQDTLINGKFTECGFGIRENIPDWMSLYGIT